MQNDKDSQPGGRADSAEVSKALEGSARSANRDADKRMREQRRDEIPEPGTDPLHEGP